MEALVIRALLFGFYIKAPKFWELPRTSSTRKNEQERQDPYSVLRHDTSEQLAAPPAAELAASQFLAASGAYASYCRTTSVLWWGRLVSTPNPRGPSTNMMRSQDFYVRNR